MDIDDFKNGSRDFRCGCGDVYKDNNFGGVYGLWQRVKARRDGIIERLYAATVPFQSRYQICDEDDGVTLVMN